MRRSDKEISLIQWVAKSYPNQIVVRLRFNLKEMQLDLVTSFHQEKKQTGFFPILPHLPSSNSAHLHTQIHFSFEKSLLLSIHSNENPWNSNTAKIAQMNPSKWLSIVKKNPVFSKQHSFKGHNFLMLGTHNIHCMTLLTLHLTWLVQQVPMNTPIYVYGLHIIWPWNVHSRLIINTELSSMESKFNIHECIY